MIVEGLEEAQDAAKDHGEGFQSVSNGPPGPSVPDSVTGQTASSDVRAVVTDALLALAVVAIAAWRTQFVVGAPSA